MRPLHGVIKKIIKGMLHIKIETGSMVEIQGTGNSNIGDKVEIGVDFTNMKMKIIYTDKEDDSCWGDIPKIDINDYMEPEIKYSPELDEYYEYLDSVGEPRLWWE